jgi:glycerol-3-phosphate acyltransferase PlsY
MDIRIVLLCAVVGYLLGSISFARVLVHFAAPQLDLTRVSVKNEQTDEAFKRGVGATTLSMALGWKAGCAVSLLDMLKVFLPTLAFRLIFPGKEYFLVLAVFGLIGNNWPVYYGYRGGSGLSAIYGGLLAIDPPGILVTVGAALLIGLILLRSMTVAFLLPLALLLPWFWFTTHDVTYVYFSLALNLFYLFPFVREAREYLRPGAPRMSERAIMEQMPMGRGMLKMLDRLGLQKK